MGYGSMVPQWGHTNIFCLGWAKKLRPHLQRAPFLIARTYRLVVAEHCPSAVSYLFLAIRAKFRCLRRAVSGKYRRYNDFIEVRCVRNDKESGPWQVRKRPNEAGGSYPCAGAYAWNKLLRPSVCDESAVIHRPFVQGVSDRVFEVLRYTT